MNSFSSEKCTQERLQNDDYASANRRGFGIIILCFFLVFLLFFGSTRGEVVFPAILGVITLIVPGILSFVTKFTRLRKYWYLIFLIVWCLFTVLGIVYGAYAFGRDLPDQQ